MSYKQEHGKIQLPVFETKKNIKITKREHALKSFTSTYNAEILNSFNPEVQLKFQKLLSELRRFKFVTTLVLVFKRTQRKDITKYCNFYLSSKAEIIINESDTDDLFEFIYSAIISNILKSLGKGSGWIIDSVINHTISISKYNPKE